MQVNIDHPRVSEQFRATWQSLDPTVRRVLEIRIAYISDHYSVSHPLIDYSTPQKTGQPVRLACTYYYKWTGLYAIHLLDPISLLNDAALRGTIARELASVLQEGRKWITDVGEAINGGGNLDPWIPEVMGECQSLDEFWGWLEDTIQYEAESTVRAWGMPVITVRPHLPRSGRTAKLGSEPLAGDPGSPAQIQRKRGLELLSNRYERQAIAY